MPLSTLLQSLGMNREQIDRFEKVAVSRQLTFAGRRPTVLTHPSWQEAYCRLDPLAGVRASGVLHGPSGVGKSKLLHHWSFRLSGRSAISAGVDRL